MEKIDKNNTIKNKFPGVLKERALIALVTMATLSITWGLARNNDVTGVNPYKFWVEKTQWQNIANVVIAGDSRTYRGVSPAILESYLSDLKALNYGFASAGYSEDYLNAIENVLSDTDKQKIIILCITPHSLTSSAASDNEFIEYYQKSDKDKFLLKTFGSFYGFFKPMTFERGQVTNLLNSGLKKTHYYEDYKINGWVASSKKPENPNEALEIYSRVFKKSGAVSTEIINGLIKRVEKWHEVGISVYGLRLPTSSEMVYLENKLTHFNEKNFIDKFENAGGIWLTLTQNKYHSYDGSHLRVDAAIQLSEDIARCIMPTSLAIDEK